MTEAFTKAETQSHLTAQYSWMPFVARLLGEGPLRGDSLPLGPEPESLNQESLRMVQSMIQRATWRFLARECGWREAKVLNAAGQIEQCRLWQQESLPVLRFTDFSIRLLVNVYNLSRRSADSKTLPLDVPGTNGDVILHHLIFRRIYLNPQEMGLPPEGPWENWLLHPLNALLAFPHASEEVVECLEWDLLFDDSLSPFLPWILGHLTDSWQETEPWLWSGSLESALQAFTRQTDLIRVYHDESVLRERPDLLAPLLRYFHRWAPTRETFRYRFESLSRSMRMRDRQQAASQLARFLRIREDLERLQAELVALHPVERDAPARLYLSAWEELDFTKICFDLEALRQDIVPTLS